MNLLRAEPQLFENRLEEVQPLSVVRPAKRECSRRAATNCGIEGLQPVCAHYDNRGKGAGGKIVNPSYQGVHTCAIFVMHLRHFTRLGERICLINQKNESGRVLPATTRAFLCSLFDF